MFKRYRRGILLLCFTLLLNGCGSMTALKEGGVVGMGEWNQEPEKVIVYPGLMTDVAEILEHGEWYRVFDFPLSFAADTVLLPYTIPAAFIDQHNKGLEAQKTAKTNSYKP